MHFRMAIFFLALALCVAPLVGCQRNESPFATTFPTVLPPDTIASVHWDGKKKVGITFGAYYFSRIWQQPQSAQLERQTLTKLAGSPGLWLPGSTNLIADACSRLWWALGDVLQEESYLEIHAASNAPAVLAFAIRLNAAQAGQWCTNLPVFLEPLTHTHVSFEADQNSWSLATSSPNEFLQLSRPGQWTLFGFGPQSNPLMAELANRIRRDGVPFVSSGTNLWLEADLKPSRLASAFGLLHATRARSESLVDRSLTLKQLTLSISGDGANVITRAKATMDHPLPTEIEPWHLPVDLLQGQMTSLTAVRGISSWLSDWPGWNNLSPSAAPDQFCLWSLEGNPFQVYLAAPWSATNVSKLTDQILQKGNPWLAAHGYISFDRIQDGNGVTWGNLPNIRPFIRSVTTGTDSWLYAGLFPDTNSAALPPPPGLIQDILRRTNVVYYDWEVTGPRLQPALQVMQTARVITRNPQLSLDSASLQWLGSIIPRLGTTATIITRTGPDELTLLRRSTLGLTAVELHLLTGWLESPQFPR